MITRHICAAFLAVLIVPPKTNPVSHVEAASHSNELNNFIGIHPPGAALKEWRLNTNFDNVDNWQGLSGHENCSRNIYSFPPWYDDEFVLTLPSQFIGKQIILPVNGHFVFREGTTTFLSATENQTTCRGREVKFIRTTKADWFDPDNWIHLGNDVKTSGQGSLLNAKTFPVSSLEAIPHVERVPCQYDSVTFPSNSSFNLKITMNVTIAKLFLGDKRKSQADTAIFMSSPLGKLQFQKAPETIFSITDNNKNNNGNEKEGPSTCVGNDGDNDRCICSNYIKREMKQKICALADCDSQDEENCQNPITPHGFCCSICGFHLRILHTGDLRLIPVYTKLKEELARADLKGNVHAHLSRYKEKTAHLVVVPSKSTLASTSPGAATGNNVLELIGSVVSRIESILKQESTVIGVTLTKSWDRLLPSDGTSDRLEGSGLGGGLITLIVILILAAILGGMALFIFMYNKKHGYPPLNLSSVTSVLPRIPSIRMPIVPGRRSSTLSSSLHSFGFARFSNERVSTVTINHSKDVERDGSGKGTNAGSDGATTSRLGKSSSIRRAEQVDEETSEVQENVIDAKSGAFGFSDVTYDLVAGVDEEKQVVAATSVKTEAIVVPTMTPILTIPEVNVVDLDPDGSKLTSSLAAVTSTTTTTTTSPTGDAKAVGKLGKPSFVASRLAKAYQKLGPDEDEPETKEVVASKRQDKMASKKKGGDLKKSEVAASTTEAASDNLGQLEGNKEVDRVEVLETEEDKPGALEKQEEETKEGQLVEF